MQQDDVDEVKLPEQFKMAGLVDKLGKGAAKYIQDALEHANKMQAAGATSKQIINETGGVAQIGLHGEPMSIVPHGPVTMRPPKKWQDTETTLADLYDAPQLYRKLPFLENHPVIPNPELGKIRGRSTQSGIEINPAIVQHPDYLQRLLAHELTHVSSRRTSGFQDVTRHEPLGGGASSTISKQMASPILKQVLLADAVRTGKIPGIADPMMMRYLNSLSRDHADEVIEAARSMRGRLTDENPGYNAYRNIYGEQLAKWMENPAGGREIMGTQPHLTRTWQGPRTMAPTREERILGVNPGNPESSLMPNDFTDFLNQFPRQGTVKGR